MRRALAALFVLAVGCDEGRTVPPGTPGPGTASDAGPRLDATPGAPDATIASGPHAARCNAACAAPAEGPCAAGSGWCPGDCSAHLDGLSATCAACVLERSGYAGERCSCSGADCTLCPFGPGGRSCGGAAPGETCEPSEERCDGFEHAKITGDDCREACVGADAGVATVSNYATRCAVACRRPSDGPCAVADHAACVTACMASVGGLPPACGLCVLDDSGWAGQRCSCGRDGTSCNLCPFGPGGRSCSSPLPGMQCEASTERCEGFELAPTSSGRCAALCD